MEKDISKQLEDWLSQIPKSIKETVFYNEITKLKAKEIRYGDIEFVLKYAGFSENYREFILNSNSDLINLDYIKQIINNRNISQQNKLLLIMPHIENMIYVIIERDLDGYKHPKLEVENYLNEIDSFGSYSIGLSLILGITYILFANTDKDYFQKPIDKRVPFRNYLLHNGITNYTKQEIQCSYKVLLIFVCVIIKVYEISLVR